MGPQGTLDFYASVATGEQFKHYPRDPDGLPQDLVQRKKLLGGLEKNLGLTLSTATQSGSPAMENWEDRVVANAGKQSRETGYYNFQVMSNLMRHGTYESDFLLKYGQELKQFEKENTGDLYGGLQRRKTRDDVLPWDSAYAPGGSFQRLHYGAANDAGTDPFTGFMEALGHNPDASTEYFKDGDTFDYLTEERKWPEDHAEGTAKKTAGYASLGHALESGSLGTVYDDPNAQLHRDADTAAVAERVVERYGQLGEGADGKKTQFSGSELMHEQDGIGKSLGRIGAAYIDDLNWGLDGSDDDRSLFAQDGTGRSSGERAHFGLTESKSFLGVLGQDPDAYAAIGHAQQAYTTSMLDTHPAVDGNGHVSSGEAETAIRTGAQVQGMIDQARGDQIKAEGAAADKAYNEAVDRRVGNYRAATGAISTGVVTVLPTPESGIAKLLVPLGGATGDSAMQRVLFNNFEDYGKKPAPRPLRCLSGRCQQALQHGSRGIVAPGTQNPGGHQPKWEPFR